LPPPVVEFPRTLADEFKIYAKTAFPREEYAIILGTVSKSGVYRPVSLYFPPDTVLHSSENHVHPQPEWWQAARKEAKARGLSLLGDIHSHAYPADWVPDKTCSPSAADMDRLHREKSRFSGFVRSTLPREGLKRTFGFGRRWSNRRRIS
jgi:hypothetical protein